MHFPFDINKATEAACRFLERSAGRMNIMKLVKLIYLLDRLSFERRGIPVVGGGYFSLPNGPVTSELLDLINSGCLPDWRECRWEEFISDRRDHDVSLAATPDYQYLSESELRMLDEVFVQFGNYDQWQLRDWCHEDGCPEWTKLTEGRVAIGIEAIGEALGKTEEQIQTMQQHAAESLILAKAFSRG